MEKESEWVVLNHDINTGWFIDHVHLNILYLNNEFIQIVRWLDILIYSNTIFKYFQSFRFVYFSRSVYCSEYLFFILMRTNQLYCKILSRHLDQTYQTKSNNWAKYTLEAYYGQHVKNYREKNILNNFFILFSSYNTIQYLLNYKLSE